MAHVFPPQAPAGGFSGVLLDVAVCVGEVCVGVVFAEFAVFVPDWAGVVASFATSEGFPLPEQPAARIAEQTRNVVRIWTSIPEMLTRAFFSLMHDKSALALIPSEREILASCHCCVHPRLHQWLWSSLGSRSCGCSTLFHSTAAIDRLAPRY